MLTTDDIQSLSDLIDKKNEDQLSQIKVLIRQEVAFSSKALKKEIVKLSFDVSDLKNKITHMQIDINNLEKRYDLLDLKIETFHHKLNTKIDKNQKEMVECIRQVLGVVGELNKKLVVRVDRIEKHLSLADA